MQKTILALLPLVFLVLRLMSQSVDNWSTYASPNQLNDVYEEADKLYLATDAGIFVVDKATRAIEHWTKESVGLPSNKVESITRDPMTHLMFIGTYDIALAYQDGGEWHSIHYPEELFANTWGNEMVLTYCVQFDEHGHLWVGTDHGLIKYDGTDWQLFNQQSTGTFLNGVWDMTKDNQGHLIVSSNLLYRVEENDALTPLMEDDFSTGLVAYSGSKTLTQDDGSYWFLTDVGTLGHYDGVEWTVYDQNDFPNNAHPDNKTLIKDLDGNIWIHTYNGTYLRYDGNTWQEDIPFGETPAITNNSSIYFSPMGVFQFTPGVIELETTEAMEAYHLGNYPFEGVLYGFFNDNEGGLWVRESQPVPVLRQVQTHEEIQLVCNGTTFYPYDVKVDHQGRYWSSGFNAVYRYDGVQWVKFDYTNTILPNNNNIRDLVIDANDNVWVYVYETGLYRFDGTEWKKLNFPVLTNNYLLDMSTDAQGKVWLAIWNTNIQTRIYAIENEQLVQRMNGYDLAQFGGFTFDDQASRLYISGSTTHLLYWDGSSWQPLALPEGLEANGYIRDMVAYNSRLIAAADNQLLIYDNNEWQVFNAWNSPLPTDAILDFGMDETGKLWISHNIKALETYQTTLVTDAPEVPGNNRTLQLFPNPAGPVVVIQSDMNAEKATYRLYNVSGQLIKTWEQEDVAAPVDISSLATGIYWVVMSSSEGTASARLVKK